MTELQQPFARFALNTSAEHEHYFSRNKLDENNTQQFNEMAAESLAKQKELESKDQIPFDDFLKQLFCAKLRFYQPHDYIRHPDITDRTRPAKIRASS